MATIMPIIVPTAILEKQSEVVEIREVDMSSGSSSPVANSAEEHIKPLSTLARKPFEHASTHTPYKTTGKVMFHNGTTDGEDAFVDFQATSGPKHNLKPQDAAVVEITDIRHFDPPCSLEIEGCTLVKESCTLREEHLKNVDEKEAIKVAKQIHFEECATLVKKLTGASKAMGYHIRYRHVEPHTNVEDDKDNSTKPAVLLHLDNDSKSAETTMREYVGADAEEWMSKRWMIINVWRPLGDPAIQYPLCVLDSTTFDFARDQEPIYTLHNYKTNVLAVKRNEAHRFYYVKDLRPEEALVFRNYDSRHGTIGLPHGAFTDLNTPKDAPPRRSVECRVLAVFDE